VAALDTNVLVRYLVGDDAAQQVLAGKLLRSAIRGGETLYVPITVTLELEWVLRSNFRLPKEQVTTHLAALLAAVELSFESEPAIEIALVQYKKNSADFADCMHIALAYVAGQSPLWTFDRTASKVHGAKMLASV
jgi:predicted nucleic-acid-binding protein